MKKFSFLIFLLLCCTAQAKFLELDMNFKISKGKKKQEKRRLVKTEFGKQFTVEGESFVAEITPTPFSPIGDLSKDGDKMVMLHAKIYKIEKGEKSLVLSPQIITVLGQQSTFSVEEDELKLILEVKSKK